jgi:hypothetical protein
MQQVLFVSAAKVALIEHAFFSSSSVFVVRDCLLSMIVTLAFVARLCSEAAVAGLR